MNICFSLLALYEDKNEKHAPKTAVFVHRKEIEFWQSELMAWTEHAL